MYVPHRPPSSSQTGRPATFPRMSQQATSERKGKERKEKGRKERIRDRELGVYVCVCMCICVCVVERDLGEQQKKGEIR